MQQLSAPQHYIVLANPSPQSFCHALSRVYSSTVERLGHTATICDLCATAFDPVLRDAERFDHGDRHHPWIAAELERLAASGALVLIYPIWFGGPPAILKGYVDRVLGAHCGFRSFRDGGAQPVLRGRHLLSITTSGTPAGWLEERGQRRALREGFDVYIERGFGLRDAGHLSFDEIYPNMSTAHAERALAEVSSAADRMCGLLNGPGTAEPGYS